MLLSKSCKRLKKKKISAGKISGFFFSVLEGLKKKLRVMIKYQTKDGKLLTLKSVGGKIQVEAYRREESGLYRKSSWPMTKKKMTLLKRLWKAAKVK